MTSVSAARVILTLPEPVRSGETMTLTEPVSSGETMTLTEPVSSGETMTSVSSGHIILTPTQPVSSLRPEQGSNLIPSGEKSGAVPTELLKVCNMGGWSTAFVDPTSFLIVLSVPVSQPLNHP